MKLIKNILVIQTAFPGDIVLTTPLLKCIRKIFPDCKLTLLTTPPGRDIIASSGLADAIISYDKNGADKGLLKLLHLMGEIRREKFDLCLSPHRSARSSLIAFISGAAERIGFSDASLSRLYTTRIVRDKSRHEVERMLSLLEPFAIELDEELKQPALGLSRKAVAFRDKTLKDEKIVSGDEVVGVAPGSVWATKSWTTEGYADLIDRLIGESGKKVLLLGAPSDRKQCAEIVERCRHKPVDLVGKTSLEELIALIDGCRLLVGNDSAPGHIATARKVPVVSIFGPTVPAFGYAPYGERVTIIEKKDIPCRPCHHHGPVECPEKHFRCMREISVEEVFDAAEEMLRSNNG